ncbi:MAG: hypothetical protein VX083_06935 [Pseudomonadota bacterium]|uniref:hypothetical protein n=1 Tax=Thalassovita sp. TaxID=1979401 RepID=UPI002AAF2C1A|nr:hypothetical protein [Thalassovita sp.]MEC8041545.1 hypothetical protein [Pseudomonadota bacterium]MEC8293213.1 hypothetical protein [Pseudomonadota bacterium]
MKLALDHPAWSLLYGPYGVQDVPGALAKLARQWDQPLADALYWEKLHHQESLYPVTYAALPWLWEIAPKDLSNLSFLSWILYCAAYRHDPRNLATPRSSYPGLSSLNSDTSGVFQRQRRALVEQHSTVLSGIEQWCRIQFPIIAERCQAALPSCHGPHDVYYLLVGPMTLDGAQKVANVLGMWCDGHDLKTIAEETEAWGEKDLQLAQKWSCLLDQHAPECGAVLRDYAQQEGGTQMVPRCNNTPDLFRED